MESNALKRCDVIIMNDSDVVDLFSNCRYLPVFSVQGHKRVSSTNEWISSRLTFPKLLSIWQKQSATWVLDGIFDSCCQMSDYLSGNSSVKCQIARYLNCTLILPSLWDGPVLFLTVPPFIHFSNPQFWGWKFWDQPVLTFRLTLSKRSTFLCCLILRHCRI